MEAIQIMWSYFYILAECIYKQLYDGFRSDCKPSYGFGGLTQEKCFIKVCNELKKGLTPYTVFNFRLMFFIFLIYAVK